VHTVTCDANNEQNKAHE